MLLYNTRTDYALDQGPAGVVDGVAVRVAALAGALVRTGRDGVDGGHLGGAVVGVDGIRIWVPFGDCVFVDRDMVFEVLDGRFGKVAHA